MNDNNNISFIKESLNRLNEEYNRIYNLNFDEDKNMFKNDDKIKDFFCNDECYNKFIKIIKKMKNKELDLSKINWSKYSNDKDKNIIVKLVTYYYNLGKNNISN